MTSLIKFSLLGLMVLTTLVGCASTDNEQSGNREVSSIPWNRPQRWESGGQLGGMTGQ
jgi:hypothetical protein